MKNIIDAINFYTNLSYKDIKVPWIVPYNIILDTIPITKIDNIIEIVSDNRAGLIGSGEQGFLDLIYNGKLNHGKYQTTTPCFRDEEITDIHHKEFIKTELINLDVSEDTLELMKFQAKEFFSLKLKSNNIFIEDTDIGQDIFFKYKHHKIELGSYGIRKTTIRDYIYGTGCAEPRLSYCIGLLR